MKLHDLRPAAGSRRDRTRVGRGIAAGKGKTAGRGTKGQKARAGASIPAWFEGGQTPIHVRVPKLRGFKNRFKVEYSVVNVGAISEYAAAGRFGVEGSNKDVPTVNAEVLASAGLIGGTKLPVKVLGHGDVSQKLFVAADAFSASARRKIEEAGGFVQLLAPEKTAEPAEVTEDDAPESDGSATSTVDGAGATADDERTPAPESAGSTESAVEAGSAEDSSESESAE
jgi:large subunit ribosomal protein L15